ncbi:MAG: glycosyltransferase family 4 protein [Chloroflexota bacterium]
MAALALLIGAAALSYIAVAYAKRWALAHQIMDIPNARSSHSRPMPRAGGIGMVATWCAGFVAAWVIQGELAISALALLGGGVVVAAIGLLDDLHGLTARTRLTVHLLAAVALVAAGARIDTLSVPPLGSVALGPLGAVISVVWIVAVTNIYNFMDGIDGIAAGVAVLTGIGLALLGVLGGEVVPMLFACVVAGSAAGFLVHNYPPASVFMGDVGSGFLGFVLAGLTLMSTSSGGGVSILAGACVLAPFLLDGTLTLLRRALRGERWYEAHRSHYYQRLVILGYSHRAVSLLYYGLTVFAVLGALGYVALPGPSGLLLLLSGIAPFFVLPIVVPKWEARIAGRSPSPS